MLTLSTPESGKGVPMTDAVAICVARVHPRIVPDTAAHPPLWTDASKGATATRALGRLVDCRCRCWGPTNAIAVWMTEVVRAKVNVVTSFMITLLLRFFLRKEYVSHDRHGRSEDRLLFGVWCQSMVDWVCGGGIQRFVDVGCANFK